MPVHASDLHVISVVSNPVRYASRIRLAREFLGRQASSGCSQWIVEAVFGDRAPELEGLVDPDCYILVRCDQEIWLKEALINLARARLPADARYAMWCDADIAFARPDWALETVQALQHYKVVQPFTHAVDLGPDTECLPGAIREGFAYGHWKGRTPGGQYAAYMHPGYAWAWRLDAWDAAGGMLDFAIAGAGDDHMAKALVGKWELSMPPRLNANYYAAVEAWAKRASAAVNGSIGYVPGTILHWFHGWKGDRAYWARWDMLRDHDFDPLTDLARDRHGLPVLTPAKPGLRDALHRYLRSRNEDARQLAWPA